jgi:hypothetical protein
MVSEGHMKRGAMPIRDILRRMRHDGCGGRAGKVDLLTGIEGASSRPVRRIVLLAGVMRARTPGRRTRPTRPSIGRIPAQGLAFDDRGALDLLAEVGPSCSLPHYGDKPCGAATKG